MSSGKHKQGVPTFDATQRICPVALQKDAGPNTHHMVPRKGVMRCSYCGKRSQDIFLDVNHAT